ncbi:MAG: hypothetical protein KatS3mg121_1105 [Gammaproteobacteria bacterium]|nr:MAG: hypothetical protein KatS3mg121_1105 [Gammaproteobacteria bacterium]
MNEMLFTLNDLVWAVTAVEALLVAALVLGLPRRLESQHVWLAVFMCLVALVLSSTLVVWSGHLVGSTSFWSTAVVAVLAFGLLAYAPALYLYLMSMSGAAPDWRRALWLHGAPAFLALLLVVSFDLNVDAWIPRNWPRLEPSRQYAVRFVWFLYKCQPVLYVVLCWRAYRRFRAVLEAQYSSLPEWSLRFAQILLIGFSFHWLWACVGYWLGDALSTRINHLIGVASNYITVVSINALVAFAVYGARRLAGRLPIDPKPEAPVKDEAPKRAAIERGIHEQRLHLEPHINLARFAEACGLRPREVSRLINSRYGQNFFEFINYHRVETVKRRLLEEDGGILEIALSSGFNSQSAFQRFFKKFTGMSPSEYRRRHGGAGRDRPADA